MLVSYFKALLKYAFGRTLHCLEQKVRGFRRENGGGNLEGEGAMVRAAGRGDVEPRPG